MSEQEKPTKYILLKVSDRSAFLIGQLLEETENGVVVHFPVVMAIGLDENDELNVTASKWFPFAVDDVVQIPKETLVAVATPKQNVIDYYHRFMAETPEVQDDSLENAVLGRSVVPQARESEWMPSSALH
jgi:hypothetical protein